MGALLDWLNRFLTAELEESGAAAERLRQRVDADALALGLSVETSGHASGEVDGVALRVDVSVDPRGRSVTRCVAELRPQLRLGLEMKNKDSVLGPPARRVRLPAPLAQSLRALADEPRLAARTLGDDLSSELGQMLADGAEVRLDDRSVVVAVPEPRPVAPTLRRLVTIAKRLAGRAPALPASDHAEAVGSTWPAVAARFGATFDRNEEHLTLAASTGTLELYLVRRAGEWHTELRYRLRSDLPGSFRVSEVPPKGLLSFLARPLVRDSVDGFALYLEGNARELPVLSSERTKQLLLELASAHDGFALTQSGLELWVSEVVTDGGALDRMVRASLELMEILIERRHRDSGPYR